MLCFPQTSSSLQLFLQYATQLAFSFTLKSAPAGTIKLWSSYSGEIHSGNKANCIGEKHQGSQRDAPVFVEPDG